jgi:hypothetical protein
MRLSQLGFSFSSCDNFELALKLGLLLAISHHFLIQYPRQAHIFTTIYSYIAGNALFLVVSLFPKSRPTPSVVVTVQTLLLFNIVYVIALYYSVLVS